jgi:hypothetical protein
MSCYIQVFFTSHHALQKQETICKFPMNYNGCGFYIRGQILKYVNNFKIINEIYVICDEKLNGSPVP